MAKRLVVLLILLFLVVSCSPIAPAENSGSIVGANAPIQDGGASDPRAGLASSDPADDSPDNPPPLIDEDHIVIFHNGTVLTMNDAQPAVKALAIQGNTILAIGTEDEVLALQTENTQLVDLGGRILMPGFIDTHSHIFTGYGDFGGSILAVQQRALAEGITTMADMGGDHGEILMGLYDMEANGKLQMRVSMYLLRVTACGEDFGTWYKDIPQEISPGSLVHAPGVKIFLDGGSCNIPAMSVDYPAGGKGDLYFTQEELNQLLMEVDRNGYQAAMHALGDRAIEQALIAIQTVNEGGPNEGRHRIEHNTTVRPDMLPMYSESHPVATIFGVFPTCANTGDTSQFKYFLPEEYNTWNYPYRSMIEANPNEVFAWHEDVPVFVLSPMQHLWGFVTRKELAPDGSICEPPDWALNEAIPVETALEIMTINSAYALFRDEEIGSLEPGKLADLIILSENPVAIDPDEIINIDVLTTMVNGRTVYCGGPGELCP